MLHRPITIQDVIKSYNKGLYDPICIREHIRTQLSAYFSFVRTQLLAYFSLGNTQWA